MRYLRSIPRRLLPDDMLVYPADGQVGRAVARMIRHVRYQGADEVVGDPYRASATGGGPATGGRRLP
jgi:hypothetical protein